VSDAPLVSVIIPVHNAADLVADGVASALNQTWPNCEVIVVDDGSSDDTVRRLEPFGDSVRVIRQEHRGPAVARNTGLRAARGVWAAFLDSDDLWRPEKLARCMAALAAHPAAGVAYTAVWIHELESGRRYLLPQYTRSGRMAEDLFLECRGVNTSTLVVRRSCLDAIGGFDEELFRAQDWDLMLRLAERTDYLHVPEPLTERRLHARSLSVTHAHLYKEYNLKVLQKALARRPDLYEPLRATAFAKAHFRFGMHHYAAFRMAEAREEFRESLRHRRTCEAMNYWMRSWLPAGMVRRLRRLRMTFQRPAAGA